MSLKYPVIFSIFVLFTGVFVVTYFGIYDSVPHFDKVMHFLGGFSAAWFFYVWLGRDLKNISASKRIVILLGLTMLIGVLWEFAEFSADHFLPHTSPLMAKYFYGGDLIDTMGDLAADLVGAFALALSAAMPVFAPKSAPAPESPEVPVQVLE